MRALWLIDSLGPGGAEALAAAAARAAPPGGGSPFEIELWALKGSARSSADGELRAAGPAPTVLGSAGLRDIGAYRRLGRRLAAGGVDVVHAHLTDAIVWGERAARAAGLPCVATLHVGPRRGGAGLAGRRGAVRRVLERRALARCARVAAVSEAVRRAWLDAAGRPRLDPARLEVVRNGIDLRPFRPEAADGERLRAALRRAHGWPLDAPVAVTVCVLREGKGVGTLLEAAPAVFAAVPAARLLVVGDGPEADALRRRAGPLAGRVAFTGRRDDVPALLAAADLFVLASRDDALPTAVLEAMAAGLPVVAADSGGVPELVEPGVTGALVPPGDPGALASALTGLLADPAGREALGRAGRRRAEERFSMGAWLDRLAALYERAVATSAPRQSPAPRRRDGGRPLRIAVVEPVGRGGLAHYAFQLCRALAEAGVEPWLVTSSVWELAELPHPFRRVELFRLWDPKPAAGAARETGLGRWARRAARAAIWYREWLRLVRFVRRERPDLVQLGDLRFAGDAVPVALLAAIGPPLVDVCHNVVPFAGGGRRAGRFALSPLARAAYRALYRRFARVAVHFETSRDRLVAEMGLPPERVVAVPHGNLGVLRELADPAVTPERLRLRLDLPPDAPVVLLFGGLAPYKGTEVLLAAIARLAADHPRARLVLAGHPLAGFDPAAQRRLAERLGVADRLKIAEGYVPSPEVAAWMELAAVVALPYLEITHSGVLHLAQTFGRPIVASRAGSLPEAVVDGVDGLLVPPGDPEALAAALAGLLADPARAAGMGAAAAEAARGRFGWDRVAAELLAAWREALEEAPAEGGRALAEARR